VYFKVIRKKSVKDVPIKSIMRRPSENLPTGIPNMSGHKAGEPGEWRQKENQCPILTFRAVLDMVTNRISTACLLVILSQPGLVFLSLLALDIASRWLQMYSTFLVGKVSHKDVNDRTNWLFKVYYGNRMFMGYCCVACE
ncbi:hypothetical protein RJ639_047537, partial [Escallonia herrerae]